MERDPHPDMMDGKDATILWQEDGDGVRDVKVVYQPRDPADPWHNPEMDQYRRLQCSNGNCCAGWMEGDPRSTPEGLYMQWSLMEHFTSKEEHLAALRELARIRECQWARDMVAAWDRFHPIEEEG